MSDENVSSVYSAEQKLTKCQVLREVTKRLAVSKTVRSKPFYADVRVLERSNKNSTGGNNNVIII